MVFAVQRKCTFVYIIPRLYLSLRSPKLLLTRPQYAATTSLSVAPAAQWTPENAKQIWSDSETEALLEIWCSQNVQDSLKGSTSNRLVYTQIAEVLVSQGYMRTPDQCQNRIKRLKANFRQFLEGKR